MLPVEETGFRQQTGGGFYSWTVGRNTGYCGSVLLAPDLAGAAEGCDTHTFQIQAGIHAAVSGAG